MGRVCQKSCGEQRETAYAVLNVIYAVVYYTNSIDAVKTMTIIFAFGNIFCFDTYGETGVLILQKSRMEIPM